MSDFLTRLALRQLGQIATIEPRVAPLYEAARETRDISFAEDSEFSPATNAPEAAAMSERTATQKPGRLIEKEGAPVMSLEQPLVQTQGRSHGPLHRLYAAGSRSNDLDPFAVEESTPRGFSTTEPPDRFRGGSTEPAGAESLPRKVMDAPSGTVPVAPAPLVQSSRSGLPEHPNEFTAPAILSSEEDRHGKGAQRAQENPVHVTIGRIEVTAMTAAASPKRAPAQKQTMSLDDYLARRQRRDR